MVEQSRDIAASHNFGWVEVICGPMFSGKTETLMQRMRRAVFAKRNVMVFKPAIDVRFDPLKVVSHDQRKMDARPIERPLEILDIVTHDVDVVGIDEAQFFDDSLVLVVKSLADRGVRVVIAGLDLDYRALPFEPMPALMAAAEFVSKQSAVCVRCGEPATRSYRLSAEQNQIALGEQDTYEARCRSCYNQAELQPTKTEPQRKHPRPAVVQADAV